MMWVTSYVLLVHVTLVSSISWLGMGTKRASRVDWEFNNCSRGVEFGMLEQEVQQCQEDHMSHVIATAASATQSECRNVFSRDRWDCSVLKNTPDIPRHLVIGTREQAAVFALSSAALGLGAARACSGENPAAACSCPDGLQPSANNSAELSSGCHFNLEYGRRFSKSFMFAGIRVRNNDSRFLRRINKHNIRLGLKIVDESHLQKCKCVGVSGSCAVKTCWRELPSSLTPLAATIKQRYERAIRVRERSFRRKSDSTRMSDDLVYSYSPDYCHVDHRLGLPGTKNRPCDPHSVSSYGCELLCCGRGYYTATERLYSTGYCDEHNCYRDVIGTYCK